MLKTPAAFLFYFSPIIKFRLCLAVYLTVYFANHLVGKVFVNEVFLELFWEGNSGCYGPFWSTFAFFFV